VFTVGLLSDLNCPLSLLVWSPPLIFDYCL
jgi:hypothetical protein